ncbi:MAG: type II toxin-antitoxin system VapC family toxin [Propionibacteriaceae bacterium]|nr:type II toxin-antitoxin system VapC family toxin [Propionibacteriaceae bacterium]
MIGIDTNILARAYLDDEPEQAAQAKEIMLKQSQASSLFISSYAILEFAWVLKTKGVSRNAIYSAILTLINSKGTTVGQRDVLLEALEKYRLGKADFGDYMILSEGKKNGSHKLETFDLDVLT